MSIGSFFSNIASKIGSWFSTAKTEVEDAFTKANGFVNIVKTFLGSVTGQTLIAILEAFIPGVATTVINDLNIFFKDFGLVQAEVNKPIEEIAADGFNAIPKLTGNSKTVALSNVASIVGHAMSTHLGGNSTLQQAIVAAPVVYNPDVLSAAPVAPTIIVAPLPDPNDQPQA